MVPTHKHATWHQGQAAVPIPASHEAAVPGWVGTFSYGPLRPREGPLLSLPACLNFRTQQSRTESHRLSTSQPPRLRLCYLFPSSPGPSKVKSSPHRLFHHSNVKNSSKSQVSSFLVWPDTKLSVVQTVLGGCDQTSQSKIPQILKSQKFWIPKHSWPPACFQDEGGGSRSNFVPGRGWSNSAEISPDAL